MAHKTSPCHDLTAKGFSELHFYSSSCLPNCQTPASLLYCTFPPPLLFSIATGCHFKRREGKLNTAALFPSTHLEMNAPVCCCQLLPSVLLLCHLRPACLALLLPVDKTIPFSAFLIKKKSPFPFICVLESLFGG